MKNTQRIVNLSMEDITAYDFGETYGGSSKWVYFGEQNDYPNYLRNLYLNSGIHQSICDSTVNLATGDGVIVTDPVGNPLSNKWLNDNFSKETIKSLLSDLKIYGYCVVEVYHGDICKYTPAIKYRFDYKDENGVINYMWYSDDWERYSWKNNKPVKIPMYQQFDDEPLSLIVIQLPKKGFDYYSPVDYTGGINYVNTEIELSRLHLNGVKNGLTPSFSITFIGSEFSDEEMDKLERQINQKFSGSANGGKAIIGFAANKDEAVQIETIEQSGLGDIYQFLTSECNNKILVAHGIVSPLLVGVRTEGGGLGSNAEELKDAYYLFFESKLSHYQGYILDGIRKVMHGNLLYADIEFKTYNPFNVTDNTQKLSKFDPINEINSQNTIQEIENNKVKFDEAYVKLNDRIFNGELNDNKLYKFVKSSKNDNIINKKLEILDKKGYVFKGSDIVKNTSDYYFKEITYIKK